MKDKVNIADSEDKYDGKQMTTIQPRGKVAEEADLKIKQLPLKIFKSMDFLIYNIVPLPKWGRVLLIIV